MFVFVKVNLLNPSSFIVWEIGNDISVTVFAMKGLLLAGNLKIQKIIMESDSLTFVFAL